MSAVQGRFRSAPWPPIGSFQVAEDSLIEHVGVQSQHGRVRRIGQIDDSHAFRSPRRGRQQLGEPIGLLIKERTVQPVVLTLREKRQV